MTLRRFSLKPLCPGGCAPRIEIKGSVFKDSVTIGMTCGISGILADLVIPEQMDAGIRRKDLWRETCVELFLAPRDSDRYWEFNLSPAGNWNVYRFESYRKGMQEEMAFSCLPFNVLKKTGSLLLDFECDSGALFPAERILQVAVTVVLKHRSGDMTYWALSHQGRQPDFHRREGLILQL